MYAPIINYCKKRRINYRCYVLEDSTYKIEINHIY